MNSREFETGSRRGTEVGCFRVNRITAIAWWALLFLPLENSWAQFPGMDQNFREPASTDAKQAFGNQRMPWFDGQKGDLVVPKLDSGEPSKARGHDKIRPAKARPTPTPRKATPGPTVGAPTSGLGEIGLSGFIWTVVIATLVVLIGLFLWLAYMRGENAGNSAARKKSAQGGGLPANRVELLPIDIAVNQLSLREQARLEFERGDLRKAFALLYGHVLLTLDQAHVIKLRRGKTNRQYLMDLADEPLVNEPFENVMLAFEQAFFGNRKLPRTVVDSCLRDSEAIEQFVVQRGLA